MFNVQRSTFKVKSSMFKEMNNVIFFSIVSFILGACLGSFYNVCIYRYISGQSIVAPGSHCPKCSHVLSWWENIPIFSYLILKGRCKNCGEKISIRYLIVELISALWSLALYIKFGFSVLFFLSFFYLVAFL